MEGWRMEGWRCKEMEDGGWSDGGVKRWRDGVTEEWRCKEMEEQSHVGDNAFFVSLPLPLSALSLLSRSLFLPLRDGQLVFLSEEERASLSQVNPCSTEPRDSDLLERLFSSDISTVYRLDRLDQSDFTYIRNQPKQEHKPPTSSRQSIISEKSDATLPYHFSYASQNALGRGSDGELLSFSLDDTFREMNEFQDDPTLFLEEGEESEVCDPTLTLLNMHHFQVRGHKFTV
ncbi:unnamed protein product [Oncorhynchus mykiss]|uniref:Uncharacterized protein n=1 Tax=Oncorhynchus mykiss TaxID=8022 RepID=A0A061A7Q8_ONCMY|nr:unnamed protein product [Oncorhynchus mykiss]